MVKIVLKLTNGMMTEYIFPSLYISPAVDEWREDTGLLLSLRTPELGSFSSCGKKQLYYSYVKVLNSHWLMPETRGGLGFLLHTVPLKEGPVLTSY